MLLNASSGSESQYFGQLTTCEVSCPTGSAVQVLPTALLKSLTACESTVCLPQCTAILLACRDTRYEKLS